MFHLGIIVPCGLKLMEVPGWSEGVHSMWNEKAGWLTLISISCVGIGIALGWIFRNTVRNDVPQPIDDGDRFKKVLFSDGIGLFLASMVFLGMTIYSFGNLFAHARVDFFRLNAGDTRGLGLLTYVFPTALSLLIIGSRTSGQKLATYSLGFLSFSVIFLSGTRGSALAPLLAGLVLWNKSGKKVSRGFALAVLITVLFAIPTIGAFRNSGKAYNKMTADDLVKSANTAKVKQTFIELGQTGMLLGQIMKYVPERDPYWYGSTYLRALRGAIPNVMSHMAESTRINAMQGGHTDPHAIRNTNPSEWLTYRVAPEKFLMGEGVGFSAIGEPYMNFGLLGVVIFFVMLGYLLGHYDALELRSDPKKFALATIVFWPLLTLPRNDMVIVVKPIAFTLIILMSWRVVSRMFASRDIVPPTSLTKGGQGHYKAGNI
jgi:oligosaccharide repeat unit polymerase